MNGGRAVKVRIKGQVQGVFYRAWTKEQAERLGVQGWVRNRLEGDVEGLFAGPDEAIIELLRLCGQGSPGAKVDEITVEPARMVLIPPGFTIKPTV